MSQIIGGSASDPNPGTAMTLAAAAYCSDPKTTLADMNNGWSAVWQADIDINGNIAFIAYNGSSQYVVAIRGSLLNFSWQAFDNWFHQDLNVFVQVPWTYPTSSSTPKISKGASDGLNDLIGLVDSSLGTTPVTMYEFLAANAIGSGISIGVVGHSLGGNLATVFAPWLLYQFQQNNITPPALFPVMTFAAPAAGNQPFAEAFDTSFPSSWRYYNEIDIVPMAPASIRSAEALYSPAPEADTIEITVGSSQVLLSKAIGGIADAVDASEITNGVSFYTQTNQIHGSVALNTSGNLLTVTATNPLDQWFEQAGDQHVQDNYLALLGQPAIACAPASAAVKASSNVDAGVVG
jgi:triacylglycerol lipase